MSTFEILELSAEVDDLKSRLEIAERALAKYADKNAWYKSHDDLECTFDSFDDDRHGWQDAQDALDAMRKVGEA